MKNLTKTCLVCNKSFSKPYNESLKNWENRRRYCSKECANKAPRSIETRIKQGLKKRGKPSWNKGIKHTPLHRLHLRKRHKKIEDTSKMRGRRPWNKIGDGVTPINERIRKSPEYKKWRRMVFEKDNYNCVFCGKKGGNKHSHHIKEFSLYPESRFEVSNGITLCIKCHGKTESYGLNQHTIKRLTNC